MEKSTRKRVLIGVLSSKLYLPTRGKAIQSTWLKEVDKSLADVKFFSEKNDDYPTVQVSFSPPNGPRLTVLYGRFCPNGEQ